MTYKERQARTRISSHLTKAKKGGQLTVSRTDFATVPPAVKVQLQAKELEEDNRSLKGSMRQWLVAW